MRAVLDTNVLISALVFGGTLKYIVDVIDRGAVTPCFSYMTWAELGRVLEYVHLRTALDAVQRTPSDILKVLGLHAIFVKAGKSPIAVPEDLADEAILACALAARSDALVTGDNHLLALADSFPIPIMNPASFKKFIDPVFPTIKLS